MKRILTALVLLLTMSLIGCDLGGNALEKALNNMENEDNVTMVMTMSDIPYIGSMQATMKLDGEYSSVETLLGVEYFKEVDGQLYAYYEGVLSDTPEEDSDENDFADFDLFTVEDFEEVNGVWVLQQEKIYVDDTQSEYMSNVEITVGADGNISLLEFDVTAEDLTMGVSIAFSDYGSTVVDVPEAE